MRLGLIARADNSGLGTLSWEFARHLKPEKVLIIDAERPNHGFFPERYEDFDTRTVSRNISGPTRDWILDVDVLFTAETFYDWSLVKEARDTDTKTVLYTMYEMTNDPIPLHPDLLLCPSKLDYDVFKDYSTRVEYLPVPVATDRLHWRKREKACHFIHSASHGGMSGRKGTQLLLDAVQSVQSDVRFTIYSWKHFTTEDPRVDIQVKNFKNYWQVWRTGDVLVYPQDYNGICLPIIEAMSSGLGVITTDIYPFNEYMPKDLLFGHDGLYTTRAASNLIETQAAKMNPEYLAEKIDEIANTDISEYSRYGREWAQENSWETLLPRYRELLEDL